MPRPLTLPPVRLTLENDVAKMVIAGGPLKILAGVRRLDGKWDIFVSFSAFDQLQTAALPKENLSDTVKRLSAYKGVA